MTQTLKEHFDEFLFEHEFVNKVRPRTIHAYRQIFRLFSTIIETIPLSSITTTTIITFFRVLQERQRVVGRGVIKTGIKKSTVATYWKKLNRFFSWLEKKGVLTPNPFAALASPSPSYTDRQFLRKEEIEKIIAAIHFHSGANLFLLKRNLSLFSILLFCGLRREEVALLQVRDIDLHRRLLRVRGETSKSGSSREIPLHSVTAMQLTDYLHIRRMNKSPYLFISSKQDKGLTIDGLKHLVTALRERSGVPFHLHQLRHTFAVNFLKHTNNIAELQQLLGHTSIQMTLTYLRCLPVDGMRTHIEGMSLDTFV